MAKRLLPPDQISPALWCGPTGELSMSTDLANAYRQVLTTRNWLQEALAGGEGGAVGGADPDATKRHFVECFAGSCARVELAALDPHETLEEASDRMLQAFAGGRLGILDIPCGAGAAALSLLSVMAVLCGEGRLPRTPGRRACRHSRSTPVVRPLSCFRGGRSAMTKGSVTTVDDDQSGYGKKPASDEVFITQHDKPAAFRNSSRGRCPTVSR